MVNLIIKTTKLFALLCIVFIFFVSHSSKADWVPVNNGLAQWNINAITATGNYIFAGTWSSGNGGVFVSTNSGASWSLTQLQTTTLSLASNANYVYAGYQNGLSYSTNFGVNWNFSNLNLWVNAILANGNYVYAGCFDAVNSTDKGVFVSTNYGINWTQTSLNNVNIYAFTQAGNNLFASGNGIYVTTNNGSNWQLSLLTPAGALASNGNYIYAGISGNGGVILSTNNGANWNQSLNNESIQTLVVTGANVFAGGSIFVSTDNGASWVQRIEGMGNLYVKSLCISNGYLFAGTDGHGVFRRPLSELVGIEPVSTRIPSEIGLSQNYPNPFNPVTRIGFEISKLGFVSLKIFDGLGKEINTLVNEQLKPGTYEVTWDGSNNTSGVYFYQLIADGNIIDTRKMIVLK